MASCLQTEGRISLYGIQLAHNLDTLMPAYVSTLEAISDFLQASPDSRVFVVGHTDMTGSTETSDWDAKIVPL
ncbi:hypothetical protein [uncultured Sulfitobacter sp.]|uniref:hypothetical protein n=1 Tax=uncultured Sulfitobacter sp. TaxID=191468 RepID=UPI002627118B|nr:hypothetical protein [uncultured Sulfitobacter sp.]